MKKYLLVKIVLSGVISFLFFKVGSAQSIILRPGIGFRFYNTKPDFSETNYFDSSFNGNFKFSEPAASIALELMYPKCSYELVFTSQHVAWGYRTNHPLVVYNINYENDGIRQFQFNYNRFYKIRNKNLSNYSPFAGIGVGIGFNRPQRIYDDTSFSVFRIYSTDFPNEYLDVDRRKESLSAISYSLVLKVGFAFKIKNVERARLQAVYNFGLNKLVRANLVYYHTNEKYFGSSSSKGSQFSLMYSMPIYLKRKK